MRIGESMLVVRTPMNIFAIGENPFPSHFYMDPSRWHFRRASAQPSLITMIVEETRLPGTEYLPQSERL